jgi:DNA-binding transcriptional LysR family regulator
MDLDMREINTFLTVADELHFGRAAQRLHITTSHVSQLIRRLERRVGGSLFDRSSRHVMLTQLGKQLLAEVAPAVDALGSAFLSARLAASRPNPTVLRVGVPNSLPIQISAEVVTAFIRQCPEVNVLRYSLSWDHYWTWLGVGQPLPGVDVVLAWLPPLPADAFPVMTIGPTIRHEPRALLMAEHHPLAGQAAVDVERLADYDVMHPMFVTAEFADAWTPPVTPGGRLIRRHKVELESPEQLAAALDGGLIHMTIASVRESTMAFPGLMAVPLTGLPMLELATVWPTAADKALVIDFAESAAHNGARLWPTRSSASEV